MDEGDLPEIRRLAQAFLDGEALPIETAVALFSYHDDNLKPKALREAFLSFVVVASETDAIPLGDRRAFWHPDVRAKEDLRHDNAQTWARPIVEAACIEILTATTAP
ncbi:MAG: hypothetical protein J7515_07665 [Caulobacter sp.]|nr:hypothetical protein [Caulobacter sp.]